MNLLEKAEKFGATIRIVNIPKISNPKEMVDMQYSDFGNTQAPQFEFFTSIFKIGGKELRNDFYHQGMDKSLIARYSSDTSFLRKHDLDLKKAIFL